MPKETSAVATEGSGGAVPPLTTDCAPHFGLLKLLFLEHHVRARQQTIMEKGIRTFKHNSPLTFSRFFAKLLATKCCTKIWRIIQFYLHAFTNVSRKRHLSVQNRYLYFVNDYDKKNKTWYVKHFFPRPAVLIFRAQSRFWIAVSGATRVKRHKPP